MKPSEVSRWWFDKATAFAADHPTDYVKLLLRKAALATDSYEIPNNHNHQLLATRSLLLASLPASGLVLSLALPGILLALALRSTLAPHFLAVIALSAGLVLTLVTWRYRMPLMLALIPFAAYSVNELWERLRGGRRLATLRVLALLLVASAVVYYPAVDARVREYQLDMAARKVEVSGEIQELLERIRREMPVPDEHILELTRAHSRQGDHEGALGLLRERLTEDADRPLLWREVLRLSHRLRRMDDVRLAQAELERLVGPDRGPGARAGKRPDSPQRQVQPHD